MVALGVAGFFLKATGMPRAPFLIGFVLAIPMERDYYLTASLYDGIGWMARPGVLAFAALLVVPVLWSPVKKLRATSEAADEGHRDEHEGVGVAGDELEGSLAGTPWSAAVAVLVVLLFGGALWVSGSFSEEARLMPRLVAVCGLVAALVLTWQEGRARVRGAGVDRLEGTPEPGGGSGGTMVATRVEPRVGTPALTRRPAVTRPASRPSPHHRQENR